MERRLLILVLLSLLPVGANAEFRWNAGLDLGLVATDDTASFADHSQTKLRYGTSDSAVQLLGGFLQVESDLDAVWNTKLAVNLNRDSGQSLGIVDAFLQYRPLPVNGIRWRAKLGAFRPPVSMEHGAKAWSALYSVNTSAVNSWVGEELGHLGAELTARSDLASSGSEWYWALSGAAFYGNDVAGTAISWRGWSLNNWQTPWGGQVPLADTPFIQALPDQVTASEPFMELDNKPGYYFWGEVGRPGRFRIRALHWNNRADTTYSGHGQSAWCTDFVSLGAQFVAPGGVGIVTQWMDGRTYAGPIMWGGRHAVDNTFDALFIMATRKFGPHRFSLRRDRFAVDDLDLNPTDPNQESGRAWTASYQYDLNERWRIGAEYLAVTSTRPNRDVEDLPAKLREQMLMLTVSWRR